MLKRIVSLWRAILVRMLMSRGRWEEVIERCDGWLDRAPEPRIFYWLGRAHLARKSYTMAFLCLKNALNRSQPSDVLSTALHYFLGVCAYRLNRNDECVTYLSVYWREVGILERHLTPSASLAKAFLYMGYAHLREARIEEAARCFERVIEAVGVEEVTVVLDLAAIYCYEEVGRYGEALALLEQARHRCPRKVEILKALSYAYGLKSRHVAALRWAVRALALNPADRWIHQQLAYLYAQPDVRCFEGAMRELEGLLAEDPTDAWAREFLARLRRGDGLFMPLPGHLKLVEKRE